MYFALSAQTNYGLCCCSGTVSPSYPFSQPRRSNSLRCRGESVSLRRDWDGYAVALLYFLASDMADRGGSKTRIRRAPLGDATDRIVNASPQKPGKHSGPQDSKPNPLRAHPISVASTKTHLKKGTALASSTLVSSVKSHAKPPAPVDTAYKNSRFSQISTSSSASNGNRKTHIGPWQLGRTLGKGSAARVRLARHTTTQDVVAVKILAKDMTQITTAGSMAELDKWDRTRDEFNAQRQIPLSIEREVAVLKLIDHPHIVKLHDIWENRAEM